MNSLYSDTIPIKLHKYPPTPTPTYFVWICICTYIVYTYITYTIFNVNVWGSSRLVDTKLGRELGWGSGEWFEEILALFVTFKLLHGERIHVISRIFLKIKTSRGFYGSRQDSCLSCCPEPPGFLTSQKGLTYQCKTNKQTKKYISLTTLRTPRSQSCHCLSMAWKIRQRHIFMNTSTCSSKFTYL